MSQTMNYEIKKIISKYTGVHIVEYAENSDTHLIVSNKEEARHEKGILDDTVEAIREKLNEELEIYDFWATRTIIKDLQCIMDYYEENWLA